MKTRPVDQSDAERAVMAFKHKLAIAVMRFIVIKGLGQTYIYPGDVPDDIVEKEHRQGVVSNSWGGLDALEIIEKLPMNFTDEKAEIFGGRKRNGNLAAKGRWTAVYRVKNAALARTWLERNGGLPEPRPAVPQPTEFQFV